MNKPTKQKILTILGFLGAGLVVVAMFLTSETYTQLAGATLLYTLLAYYILKLVPRRTQNLQRELSVAPKQTTIEDNQTSSVTDTDRRAFLKLIGTVGISYFIFSIFTRRSEPLFFGKAAGGLGTTMLKDPKGNEIEPAQQQPTDGYQISDFSTNENNITFYGFTRKNGNWFIMKEDPQTGSFRYVRGNIDFPVNWTNRERLIYDYFHNVFP